VNVLFVSFIITSCVCFFLYLFVFFFFFFFFSSRRRHTRSDRDWSSDVCSSDLRRSSRIGARPGVERSAIREDRRGHPRLAVSRRSEERRVGKECRSRWAADH